MFVCSLLILSLSLFLLVVLANETAFVFRSFLSPACRLLSLFSIVGGDGHTQRPNKRALLALFFFSQRKIVVQAIESYHKSLTEHYSDEANSKLKDAKKRKVEAERMAYLDDGKALEAKERGNEHFRAGNYTGKRLCRRSI